MIKNEYLDQERIRPRKVSVLRVVPALAWDELHTYTNPRLRRSTLIRSLSNLNQTRKWKLNLILNLIISIKNCPGFEGNNLN